MLTKNIKLAKTAIFLAIVSLLIFTAAPALAQSNSFGLTTRPLSDIIEDVIVWLLGISIGLAILFLIIGGIYYITAAGDQSQMESAKKIIKYAVIGLFVIGISYSVVKTVASIIG